MPIEKIVDGSEQKYLGLGSLRVSSLDGVFDLSTGGTGETGRSRSSLKSMFNRSGRFLLLLPDRALRAHDRSAKHVVFLLEYRRR